MKKHLLSFIAIVIAIAAVAFTPAPHSRAVTDHWYFTGNSDEDEDEEELYVPLNGQDELCPGSSTVNCVIIAPEKLDGQQQPMGIPDLSSPPTVDSVKP